MKKLAILLLALVANTGLAQDENLPFGGTEGEFNWIKEGEGELGEWATLKIPAGTGFLNGNDTNRLLKMWGNLGGAYVGSISSQDLSWTVIFSFAEEGYVKDDEKDELDADKIMKSMKEMEKESNKERERMGLEKLNMTGWAVKPKYNEDTNNLEWGTIVVGESGGRTVNYETRLLGRHGYMNVTLLCEEGMLNATLPGYQELLKGFSYSSGKSYAEYRDGDKVAKYGLTALVAGGAALAAAKTGLLGAIILWGKKFIKLIIAGLVVAFIAIKRFFSRAVGREEA